MGIVVYYKSKARGKEWLSREDRQRDPLRSKKFLCLVCVLLFSMNRRGEIFRGEAREKNKNRPFLAALGPVFSRRAKLAMRIPRRSQNTGTYF